MEVAVRLAVHLLDVLDDADAELVEVQVGVAGDQRIVRPVDNRRPERADGVALVLLELAPEPEVARLLADSEHVRPVHHAAALDAGQPEDEAEQPTLCVERSGGDAADALADLEDARGD
jgi:hypothetical protein